MKRIYNGYWTNLTGGWNDNVSSLRFISAVGNC